jgi:hypothetical protein
VSPEISYAFDLARTDGWFHVNVGIWDVPRGPLGVLLYLPLVPLFWITPVRAARAFLIASSLFVWYATLGPAFVMFTLALLAYYFFATKALTEGGRIVWRDAGMHRHAAMVASWGAASERPHSTCRHPGRCSRLRWS